MFSKKFWIAVGTLLFFSSCNRSAQSSVCPRIKAIFNTSAGFTSTYFYSPDGKLSVVKTSGGGKTTYQYTTSNITAITVDSNGHLTGSSVYYLNTDGLVDSLVNMDSSNIVLTKKFLYYKDGFVKEEKMYVRGWLTSSTRNVVKDGNITLFTVISFIPGTEVRFNPVTNRYDTLIVYDPGNEYSVFTDHDAGKVKTLTFENYGLKEFGRGSKNIERVTVQTSSSGDTIDVSYYKYTFDKEKRISSCVIHSENKDMYDSSSVVYY